MQALARDISARKEIVILDDSLSALDTATDNHIFYSLMGKMAFTPAGKLTIFIALSLLNRLLLAFV